MDERIMEHLRLGNGGLRERIWLEEEEEEEEV